MLKQNNFILLLLAATLFGMYFVYQPFLETLLIAALLGVATSTLYIILHGFVKNDLLSAIVASFVFAILFFAPFGYFITNLAIYTKNIDQKSVAVTFDYMQNLLQSIPKDYDFIKTSLNEFISGYDISTISKKLLSISAFIGKASAGFVKEMLLIVIFYGIFMFYGKDIVHFIKSILPMSNQNIESIYTKVSSTMSVVFYSIIATAVFEGILFGLLTSYLGFNGILFGILYGFASLVPVVGGVIMWVPLFIYELSIGNTYEAYFVMIYSIVVISIVADTFIKPIIINKINNILSNNINSINSLLIFFSIIAGLSSVGFWGMIIGPALTSLFFAVVAIVKDNISNYS